MAKKKYYVVWVGKNPGVYDSWAECQKQTSGVPQAKFKSYSTMEAAEKAYKEGWKKHWGQGSKPKTTSKQATASNESIDYNSISVDVGTRGNPGPVEYQGVDTKTGEVVFSHGPFGKGTNNIGEFLAIVHALAYLKEKGSTKTIYTDSLNAMKWVREKRVSTTLVKDDSTRKTWELIERAEKWLQENTYPNAIKKWETKKWGEIKADYGRK